MQSALVNMYRIPFQICVYCQLKTHKVCANLYTDLKSCIQVARKKYKLKLKRNLNRKGKCRHKRKSRLKESKIKGN